MSEQLKRHQKPMSIDEQIDNLKALGLIIGDEAHARKLLNDISYFRLIKAYSLDLKPHNGKYFKNVTFEHIVELYLFNANLRQLLFPIIERIEVNARCRIANYVSEQYGVLGYKNKDNFVDENYHRQFLDDIAEEIERNRYLKHSSAPLVEMQPLVSTMRHGINEGLKCCVLALYFGDCFSQVFV
ncbi:MAG: Abi family protein [Butyrivibrio sp.]|nr:Abi family protein [Butyrivibrio sp.]